MKVLLVEPNRKPREIEIPRGLRSLQKAVDGPIEAIYPFDDPVALVCNEEANLRNLPWNREVGSGCVVRGSFIICSVSGEHFDSLPGVFMKKYRTRFGHLDSVKEINHESPYFQVWHPMIKV